MKIIHAHKYFHSRDGASRYERGLMRLQEEAGHSVAPFAMHDDRNEPTHWSEYFVSNVDTRRIAPGLGAFAQAGRALWSIEAKRKFSALLDVFRPDIIHAHNIYTHLSPSILSAARKRDIPVVMTVHDYALVNANYSLWNQDRPMRRDQRGFFATARTRYIKNSFFATGALEGIRRLHHAMHAYDGAIAQYTTYSHFVRDVMVEAGFSADKISVVQAFAEPFMHHGAQRRTMTRKKEQRPFVLFAGRLETYKGVHVLIEAAKYLPPDARIVIAGVGENAEHLRARAGGDSRIEFLGFVPGNDLWALMGRASVVVVPSIWPEVYGLVALEAMCQGTPIIVAKSGGLPEVVGESDAGIIVPAGDTQALARAIRRIMENPSVAERMGKAGYARAQEIGDPQVHLAKIMEIYSRCG